MTVAERNDGFPHKGYPSGWFQVAWAGELEVGDVRPLHYFGQDLVLYRGKRGYHVLDAFCPHMGAHFGHGRAKCIGSAACRGMHGARTGESTLLRSGQIVHQRRRHELGTIRGQRIGVATCGRGVGIRLVGREDVLFDPGPCLVVGSGRFVHERNARQLGKGAQQRPQFLPHR